MDLLRFSHKGLKHFYMEEDCKNIPHGMADKLRRLLFALETADNLEQVKRFPGWKLHPLKGNYVGFWSLTITGNWRLIFRYDENNNSATDLNLVDYH
jgi:proteic killer suppression protein